MAGWRSKKLGDGMKAFTPTTEIQNAFFLWALAQSQAGDYSYRAALFSEYNLEENVVTVYFSPDAEPLGKMLGATPCDKPIPTENFNLSFGDQRAFEQYFPDYLEQRRSNREK